MKEYKLNFKLFLTIIALFSIIVVGIVLMITKNYNLVDYLILIRDYGYVTIPLTFIWFYFVKWGWRCWFWKWTASFIKFPPDIRGRWEGNLVRYGEKETHKLVFEIKQTLSKLQVYSYSATGHSESILDSIASDKMEDDFYLTFLWQGEAGIKPGNEKDSRIFNGYTILKLIERDNEKILSGNYFTNRKPNQTMGTIEVKWVGFNLKKQL
ncbi:MAG TPA: hypothetical protein VIK14_17290 [Ignavibacteria bacterium]